MSAVVVLHEPRSIYDVIVRACSMVAVFTLEASSRFVSENPEGMSGS
jgi:hypothetical protein